MQENTPATLPTIAIVGRPNVGKSSLFNAIVGRRLAIVHEMSGVTRDRVAARVQRNGRSFTLVDTGGLGMLTGESRRLDRWDAGIAQQVEAAVADADVLIMVGDAQDGLTPLDADVAARLRNSGKPIIFAANKCDDDRFRIAANEFAALGFGEVFPVCCLRLGGVNALLDAAFARLPEKRAAEAELPPPAINIAVVGRPNVGKSSLINALIGSERVMTSEVAGTTRDAIDVDFSINCGGEPHRAVLVDTAGLRKRAKVDTVVEYFSAMRARSAIERADLVVLVVEATGDAASTAQDRKIAAIIEKAGKGCVIAVNKCDAAELPAKTVIREIRQTLPGLSYAPLTLVSARKRLRLDELLDRMAMVMENLQTELPTGVLNRVLQDAFQQHPPPLVGTAPLKLFYASMVGSRPPRIRLFVNRPDAAADNYLTFLKKRLREAFELTGVPVVLELRARPKAVESIRRNNDLKRKTGRKKA